MKKISFLGSGSDGGPHSLTIIDYTYRYIKPSDQCRAPIFYFWTPQPKNGSTFKTLLIISSFFNMTNYIDSSCCRLNETAAWPGNGYCSCPELDQVHGYTIYLQLIQTVPGQSKPLLSNTFTRRLNFIGKWFLHFWEIYWTLFQRSSNINWTLDGRCLVLLFRLRNP